MSDGFIKTALEIEQALLGALLFRADLIEKFDELKREHFFDPLHQLIFQAIETAHAAGAGGPVSIAARLAGSPGFQEANGKAYLEQLAANVPSIAGATDYAKAVTANALRRNAHAILSGAASQIYSTQSAREFLEKIGDDLDRLGNRSDQARDKDISDAMSGWLDRLGQVENGLPGLRCGLKELDEALGGIRRGKLTIIGGRPGSGKSTLMNWLAAGIARSANAGVCISTLETDAEDIPVMMVTDLLRDRKIRLPYAEAERGMMNDEQATAFSDCAKQISSLPIIIDDTPRATASHIRRFVKRSRRRFAAEGRELAAVIVDYLGLVRASSEKRRHEQIGELTAELMAIAKEFNVAMIVGCQLNREAEKRDNPRPTLADLRESGDIEQDAFAVLLLFREIEYLTRARPMENSPKFADWQLEMERLSVERPLEIIIAKNRRGPKTTVTVWCEIETATIRDRGFNMMDPLNEDRRERTRTWT